MRKESATSALLYYPEGIALDSAGNLYVADEANNEVREVAVSSGYEWGRGMTADDIYSVVGSTAGTAGDEGDGGPAGSAELNGPIGLSVDPAGNLLIADSGNNLVREVTETAASDFDLLPVPSGVTLNRPRAPR